MTSVSASHITLTPTQPVGNRRPQRELNQGPPHQEWSALLTEIPPPPPPPSYAGVKIIVKTQRCHSELTVKTGERMEEVTVKAVSTVL